MSLPEDHPQFIKLLRPLIDGPEDEWGMTSRRAGLCSWRSRIGDDGKKKLTCTVVGNVITPEEARSMIETLGSYLLEEFDS